MFQDVQKEKVLEYLERGLRYWEGRDDEIVEIDMLRRVKAFIDVSF